MLAAIQSFLFVLFFESLCQKTIGCKRISCEKNYFYKKQLEYGN
jgi:hypothetical protein